MPPQIKPCDCDGEEYHEWQPDCLKPNPNEPMKDQIKQAKLETLEAIIKEVEGMKKTHREFECNGANGGKGCYEDWCNMETCTSKDAIECKAHNLALSDLLATLQAEKELIENNK